MKYAHMDKKNSEVSDCSLINYENLRADCGKCFGFCCVALYFSASEGFPENKDAGKPCINLQQDFRCRVHKDLRELGLKGCTAYDCFGAGQKVAEHTYAGKDWRQVPESAKQMYDVFLIVRQLHEMLWYLSEALRVQLKNPVTGELSLMLKETEALTLLSTGSLLNLDIEAHRVKVNTLLSKVSELVRAEFSGNKKTSLGRKKTLGRGLNLIGADLRKKDLKGENLRGAYLIASDLRGVDLRGADLIGADLRDADIRGANLKHSIFLTQAQINTAKGDSLTKLPETIIPPSHWANE